MEYNNYIGGDDISTINERFRQVRESLGVSQDDFATRANRTRSEIKNIEYGKTDPKNEIINSVCSAWGVNDVWLRTGTGEMFQAKTSQDVIMEYIGRVIKGEENEFQRRLILLLSQIPAEFWPVLEAKAKAILCDDPGAAAENKKEEH